MKNNQKEKKDRNYLEIALIGVNWFSLIVATLVGIKVISFVHKKSILQLGIEGLNSDTMTTLCLVVLAGLLLSSIKLTEGYKVSQKAKNLSYSECVERKNEELREMLKKEREAKNQLI